MENVLQFPKPKQIELEDLPKEAALETTALFEYLAAHHRTGVIIVHPEGTALLSIEHTDLTQNGTV